MPSGWRVIGGIVGRVVGRVVGAVAIGVLLVAGPGGAARAQDLDKLFRNDLPPAPPATAEPASPEPQAPRQVTAQDCQRLQPGVRFVRRVGEAPGPIPIRFLEGFVLDRPLAEFGSEDFASVEEIGMRCGFFSPMEGALLDNFRDKVLEAQSARDEALDWVARTLSEVEDLTPGREALIYLNTAWNEMLRREPVLLASDMQVVAAAIVLKQEQIYQRTPVPQGRTGATGPASNEDARPRSGLPIGERTLPFETGD